MIFKCSRFVNFNNKLQSTFSDLEYFVHKYSTSILQPNGPEDFDKLHDEFIAYQLIQISDIPDSIWKKAEIDDNEESGRSTIHRMDVIWCYLSTFTLCDGTLRFAHLSKVACLMLLIPHSNAEEERVFSIIRKNKLTFEITCHLMQHFHQF